MLRLQPVFLLKFNQVAIGLWSNKYNGSLTKKFETSEKRSWSRIPYSTTLTSFLPWNVTLLSESPLTPPFRILRFARLQISRSLLPFAVTLYQNYFSDLGKVRIQIDLCNEVISLLTNTVRISSCSRVQVTYGDNWAMRRELLYILLDKETPGYRIHVNRSFMFVRFPRHFPFYGYIIWCS